MSSACARFGTVSALSSVAWLQRRLGQVEEIVDQPRLLMDEGGHGSPRLRLPTYGLLRVADRGQPTQQHGVFERGIAAVRHAEQACIALPPGVVQPGHIVVEDGCVEYPGV